MAFKLFSDNAGHFFFFYALYNQHKFHFFGGGRGVGSPSELILLAFRLPLLPFQLANFLFIIIIIIIFHERQLTYKESKREYREYPTGDLIFLHIRTSIYAALNV